MNTVVYHIYVLAYLVILLLFTILLKKYYRIYLLDLIIVSNGFVSFLAIMFILFMLQAGYDYGLRADPANIISLAVAVCYYFFKIAKVLKPQRPEVSDQ